MFQSFSVLNYSLILIALLSQYGIGKRLVSKPLIITILCGVSFTGLIVGILANVLAGLIKPFIIMSIVGGALLTIYEFYKKFNKEKPSVKSILRIMILIFLGSMFFLLNNPSKVHFEKQGDLIQIPYDPHFTNYASLSLEMLDANYFSRLKKRSFYPEYWSAYHFFNSGVFSVGQALITVPNLWTYFMVQTVVMILIFLAILEWFFCRAPSSIYHYILLALWVCIICTLYSIEWQFRSTGSFSVLALVFMSISIFFKKYKEAIFFSVMLGISAFRLFPISLCIIAFILIKFIRLHKHDVTFHVIKQWIRNNCWMSIYFILFLLYNFITLISPLFFMIIINFETVNDIFSLMAEDGFKEGLSFLLEARYLKTVAFLKKAYLVFNNFKYVFIVSGLFMFSFFSLLMVRLYYLVKKKKLKLKTIFLLGGLVFLSFIFIKNNLLRFLHITSDNFYQLFFDLFHMYNYESNYAMFSCQVFFPILKSFFNYDVHLLFIRDYPILILGLVSLCMLVFFIAFMLKQWKKCWKSYYLESFFERNKKTIIICVFLFFISSLKLSLFILPYFLVIPFFIWYLSQVKTNISLQDKHNFLFFFLFCIGLAYCYQFFNKGALGGPVLTLFCDGIIVSLLLIWFSLIKKTMVQSRVVFFCLTVMVLISTGFLFGTRFEKKQSVIAYLDHPHFCYYHPSIVLDELAFNRLQAESKDFYIYQEDKSVMYNDFYSSVLGKRMLAHKNVLYSTAKLQSPCACTKHFEVCHASWFIFRGYKLRNQLNKNTSNMK